MTLLCKITHVGRQRLNLFWSVSESVLLTFLSKKDIAGTFMSFFKVYVRVEQGISCPNYLIYVTNTIST